MIHSCLQPATPAGELHIQLKHHRTCGSFDDKMDKLRKRSRMTGNPRNDRWLCWIWRNKESEIKSEYSFIFIGLIADRCFGPSATPGLLKNFPHRDFPQFSIVPSHIDLSNVHVPRSQLSCCFCVCERGKGCDRQETITVGGLISVRLRRPFSSVIQSIQRSRGGISVPAAGRPTQLRCNLTLHQRGSEKSLTIKVFLCGG